MSKDIEADDIFTWDEFCEKAAIAASGPSYLESRTTHHNSGFVDISFDEAMKMATVDGYHSAIPKIEQLSKEISNTVFTDRPINTYEIYHDVSGGEVDIAMYLSDVPECMIEVTPTVTSKYGRVIRLIVNVGIRAEINSQTVLNRGAAIVALVDLMSRSQHPLEIWACNKVRGNHNIKKTLFVKVLDSNEPLDIGRVAFAVAHPAMLRRLIFSLREQYPNYKSFGIPTNYGWSGDIDLDTYPDSIMLPRLSSNSGWDMDSAVAWIEREMTRIFD